MTSDRYPTVQLGQPAPDFDLPLVDGSGRVRLDDYRGRSDLLLVLLRSFECPFCRRNLASLKHTAKALQARGVETLAVTTTSVEAASLYIKYRPPGLPLASDPLLGIHRDFQVPIYRFTEDQPTRWPEQVNVADIPGLQLKPSADFPETTMAAVKERYDAEDDLVIEEQPGAGPPDDVSPLVSYFLIDRTGIVRWVSVIAFEDPTEYAQHPSHADLLTAADVLAA